jgi:hypothetical protein
MVYNLDIDSSVQEKVPDSCPVGHLKPPAQIQHL